MNYSQQEKTLKQYTRYMSVNSLLMLFTVTEGDLS